MNKQITELKTIVSNVTSAVKRLEQAMAQSSTTSALSLSPSFTLHNFGPGLTSFAIQSTDTSVPMDAQLFTSGGQLIAYAISKNHVDGFVVVDVPAGITDEDYIVTIHQGPWSKILIAQQDYIQAPYNDPYAGTGLSIMSGDGLAPGLVRSSGWDAARVYTQHSTEEFNNEGAKVDIFRFDGVTFAAADFTMGMTYNTLTFGYLVSKAGVYGFKLVDNFGQEAMINFDLSAYTWHEISIPLSDFTAANGAIDLTNITQIVHDAQTETLGYVIITNVRTITV